MRPPRNEQADGESGNNWHGWLKKRTHRLNRRHFKKLIQQERYDDIHETQERKYFGYET